MEAPTPTTPTTPDSRGVVPLQNPQKTSHCTPDEGCHGLVLPNPSRCAFIGGVSSGKTNALLCTLGNCHAWKAFEYVYLMSRRLTKRC